MPAKIISMHTNIIDKADSMRYFFALFFIFFGSLYSMGTPHGWHVVKNPSVPLAHTEPKKMQINDMKGFYTHLHPYTQPYSPLHGPAMAYGRILKNIACAHRERNPMFAFAYDQHIGLFKLSKEPIAPSKDTITLTPFTIGRIICARASNTIELKSEQESLSDLLTAESNKRIGKSDARYFINTFIKASHISGTHEHAVYLSGMPQLILLAYLYQTARDRNDLIDYLKGLGYHHAPIFKKESSLSSLEHQTFNETDRNTLENSLKNLSMQDCLTHENIPFLIKPVIDDSYESLVHYALEKPPICQKIQSLITYSLGKHHNATALSGIINYAPKSFSYLSHASEYNQMMHFILSQNYDTPHDALTCFRALIRQRIAAYPPLEELLTHLSSTLSPDHKPLLVEDIHQYKEGKAPSYLLHYLNNRS